MRGGKSRTERDKGYRLARDNQIWAAANLDKIGNAYYGSDFISSQKQETANGHVIGGVTRGNYIYMNTGDDGSDYAQNLDLVEHEVGHTFGLEDPLKLNAPQNENMFHPTNGIMEYTEDGKQKPINSNDVLTVYEYAKEFLAYQRLKKISNITPKNKNFEGRAKVGLVMTIEEFKKAMIGAATGLKYLNLLR